MKKILLTLGLLFCFSCKAQIPLVENLSSEKNMNYTFALIDLKSIVTKELYDEALYITVYKIYDPIATPKDFNPTDGHDVLDSYIISLKSSDTYINSNDSRLFKIKGVYNSKILEIKEISYPKFSIKIEYGVFNKRKVKSFEFTGVE